MVDTIMEAITGSTEEEMPWAEEEGMLWDTEEGTMEAIAMEPEGEEWAEDLVIEEEGMVSVMEGDMLIKSK